MTPSLTDRLARMPVGRLAWRNLHGHWRHSLGSLLSIVVGFVAIALFQGYLDDLEDIQARWNEQRGMIGSLVIERAGASGSEGRQDPLAYPIDADGRAFVDAFLDVRRSEVAEQVRVLQVSGLVTAGRASAMFLGQGHDVDAGARLRGGWAWNAVAGRPLHVAGGEGSIMLGGRLARLLDCDGPPVTDAVGSGGAFIAAERPFTCRQPRVQLSTATVSGQINAIDLDVSGLIDAGLGDLDARFVLMPLAAAQRLLDTDDITAYHVALARRDAASARAFAAAFNAAAGAEGLPLVATPWREHAFGEMYRRGMGMLGIYRALVVLVVLAIAGMSVFTTMLKAVNERVREVGTLRSLGFRQAQIVRLFTLEGGLLALVGSAAGLALAAALIAIVNAAGITYSAGVASQPIPLSVSLRPATAGGAAGVLALVAIAAAWSPARRAARLPIPDALGHA